MQAKLTKRLIDSLEPGRVDYMVWDTELKRFGVKATPSGARIFLVQYWAPGLERVRRRYTIGAYGPLTPDQARAIAQAKLGEIASGKDPWLAAKDGRTNDSESTVSALSKDFLSEVSKKLKPTTAKEYARLFGSCIVPTFGKRPIRTITNKDIEDLHGSLKEHPYQANRTLQLLKTFFYWTEKRGHRLVAGNPCKGVEKFTETASERFLSAAEVERLGKALVEAETTGLPPAPQHRKKPKSEKTAKLRPKSADTPIPANPYAVAAIRFLLLTGWREQEALTLTWAAVDLERRFAALDDTKTNKSYRPLGAPAIELLKALPTIEGSPYVFPGAKPEKPLREIKRVWYAARHAAKLNNVRLHDLRHTVASFSIAAGHSLFLTGKLLGHKRAETTQRYAHLADDARLATADSVSATLATALGSAPKQP